MAQHLPFVIAIALVCGLFLMIGLLVRSAFLSIPQWTPQSRPQSRPRTPTPRPGKRELEPWREDVSVIERPELFDYAVYTSVFDEEIGAVSLVSASGSARLHARLELLLQQRPGLEADVSEALAPVAAQLGAPASVTLLLDNSGSLRGRLIVEMALASAAVAGALDAAGAEFEILGFTTSEWRGGKSRAKWKEEGRPSDPGRLNDLRHIVYKAFEQPAAAAQSGLAALLLAERGHGYLKENIDGEALIWAYRRLLARSSQRRVLLIVSDGAPVDDSTLDANTDSYLERHLRHVARDIERRGCVTLAGVGGGHDVSRYYSRSQSTKDFAALAVTIAETLVQALRDDPDGPAAA